MELSSCISQSVVGGYRHRVANGRLEHAHRLVWIEAHGPIPEGHVIHHICENPGCINLEHLQAVTHKEHAYIHRETRGAGLRRYIAERQAATHCRHGHEWTEQNTRIGASGERLCRKCHAECERKRRARLRDERSNKTWPAQAGTRLPAQGRSA